MPEVSFTEWVPGPGKVHSAVPPRVGELEVGTGPDGSTSASAADGINLPTWLPDCSVNQMLPSGPWAIPPGRVDAEGVGNSVTEPEVVIRPSWWAPNSVNQRLDDGPDVMRRGSLRCVSGNSVIDPVVVV